MITRTFKLCLNAGTGSAPYINVSQYDEGETWLFELYSETGERYIPTTGAIVGVKSDGHGIANTGTVDSEGRVVITETEQMTAAAGRAIYELSIDGLTHGTANFIVNVEKKPIDGAIMSDSDLSLISQAIDSAAVIVDVIGDGDPSEVIGEHVDAWLDAHPEATTTVEDGAITAPKINQSLWDKLLVSEEASGAVASFDDGADDVPVSSLKVALEPIQTGSGDPSPTNIRPIVASNGKNKWSNGAVTGTAYVEVNANVPTGTYTFSAVPTSSDTDGTTCLVYVTYANNTTASYYMNRNSRNSVQMTSPQGNNITKITLYASDNYSRSQGDTFTFADIMLEEGTAMTPYQPYQGIMVDVVGKNLLPMTLSALKASNTRGTWNGNTYTDTTTVTFRVDTDSNGNVTQIVTNGTGTAEGVFYIRAYDLPNGSYIFSGCPSGAAWNTKYRIRIGDKTDAYINDLLSEEKTITVTNGITLQINTGSGYACNNLVFKPMIRYASVADATFEPYTSTSYPYTLGREVYGGTVDLATGVLTVDKLIVDMGTATYGNANALGWSQITSVGAKRFDNSVVADVYCDILVADTANRVYQRAKDNSIGINSAGRIQFVMSSIANYTSAQIQTALTGHYVVYPLATPTTVQLTPTQVNTLLGYNNISSSGTVDVIYHADTKLYVDKLTNVDNAIIAPTEADFVATRNYTTNDLVIVNDTLYKVTANIASGSAITPNSNVQQTTLGALIKALS